MTEVTIFKNIRTTSAGFTRVVGTILARIKDGKSKDVVEKLRNETDAARQKTIKETLPGICFSGTFRHRSLAGLIDHSGLICLDFDKFPDNAMLSRWRETLTNNPYTYCLFTSPSGNGLKVVVKIPAEPKNHKLYFDALKDYYKCEYFDVHCSDICRLCFESYDPEMYLNEDSTLWSEKQEIEIHNTGTETPILPVKSENRIIQNLLTWFNKKYSVTKGNRNANLFKLATAFNDFGVSKNEAQNTFSQYQQSDFNEREISAVIDSAYKKTENFGTKYFEDDASTQKIERAIRSGKNIKEIKKDFPEFSEQEIESSVSSLKETLTVTDFWTYSENGAIKISHHKYKFFLEERQFFKFFPNGSSGFVFVKIEENLLDDTSTAYIKDYVMKYLQERKDIGYAPFDYMASQTKYFKEDYLSFLETAQINLKEDTIDECFIYFKNACVKITKNTIQEIDYVELDGFVWKKQIITREFKKNEFKDCVFQKFLFLIAGKNEDRYNSLRSVIGYLMHSFKTSANNKAIILNDEAISENPNGGSGKGLFWNALSHVKKLDSIDGKQFEFGKPFNYQTVSPDTQILVFDDVKKNFAFENLFSLITEGITLEKKNMDAMKINVNKSPKIVITTNYTVGGIGGSFERRKFEVELSSYFSANHTPLDEFGHMLFDEWGAAEWCKFDNFMISCVQYYLNNGLVKSDYQNLDVRKFIKETSYEFKEWADEENFPTNVKLTKGAKYSEFISEYPDYKKWLTQKRFSQWIDSLAKFKGYTPKSGKDLSGRWVLLEGVEVTPKKDMPS